MKIEKIIRLILKMKQNQRKINHEFYPSGIYVFALILLVHENTNKVAIATLFLTETEQLLPVTHQFLEWYKIY